jgi:RNA polymerase sigma-70 factor (ECF subfamily)
MLASADLDEIYADVMMQLVREDMHKLRLYDPARGTKLGSWIGMISVNAAYDFLRSAGRRPLLDKVDGAIDPHDECDRTPLDQLIEKERWEHLNSLLDEFTAKDRTFVELYYQKGLPADEIAAKMRISLKTVYSKKHKIRAHLVRCLERLAGDSPIADLAAA